MSDIQMCDPKGGNLYFNERTGQYYPAHLDITLVNAPDKVLSRRWAYCNELVTAKIAGTNKLGKGGTSGSEYPFVSCAKLERLEIPDSDGCNSFLATSCVKLSEVILGGIGKPVSGIYSNAFSASGTMVTGEKTITIYVADATTIPLADAPWGLTGATVIYRSSTTGEIREVPSE